MIRNKLNSFFIIPIFSVFFYFLLSATALSANFPLEIINIKPAGTGSPAIPSTNRIFRAYPGMEYNIRAAVIGGMYPFSYSLSNSPAGMTINSATGEISWPNPQSNSGTITLSVTDAESTTVSTTWAITVSVSGFVFVSTSYSGTENGSITQPYSSLANMMSNEQSNPNAIIYFRAGSYTYPSGYSWINELGMSLRWIGYPGETVNVDNADREIVSSGEVYVDSINFSNMTNSGVTLYGLTNYQTVRRCVFDDMISSTSVNNNQGMLKAMCSESGHGTGTVIQDNEFKNFQGTSAIGSLYHMRKFLIENNYIHSALGQVGGPVHNGLSPKAETEYFTVRGNKFIMENGWLVGHNNSAMQGTIEFCFNLFANTSGSRSGIMMNWNLGQDSTYFYRNTLVGDLVIRTCPSGPYTITNNVISNPNTSWGEGSIDNFITYNNSSSCFTSSNNLTGTNASSLVDSADNYKLVPAQSSYVGTRGWQLADGSTPMDRAYTQPPATTPQPPTDFQKEAN